MFGVSIPFKWRRRGLLRPGRVKAVGVRSSLEVAPSIVHRLATSCGQGPAKRLNPGESFGLDRTAAHWWKAPRVQRILDLFAEVWMMRPLAWAASACASKLVPQSDGACAVRESGWGGVRSDRWPCDKQAERRPRKPTSFCLLRRDGLRGGIAGNVLVGLGWRALGAGFSFQFRSDLATRGVRANRVGEKLRRPLASGRREVLGSESWPASDLWKLGWHPTRPSHRAERSERCGCRVSPGGGGWCGGRGPNPFRRFPPSPAQAGGATASARAGDRAVAWLCSRTVSGCRSRRAASGPSVSRARAASSPKSPLGSGHPALCTGGERASKAGSRWRHRGPGDGLSEIPFSATQQGESRVWCGSGGGSTRRGKAFWFHGSRRFWRNGGNKGTWQRVPGTAKAWAQSEGCDRERQRLRHELGEWSKTPPLGNPARRSCDRSFTRTVRGSRLRWPLGPRSCRTASASRSQAEAGASPSSEASPELPEVIGQRWRSAKRTAARLGAGGNRESDSPEGARFVSRLQKLERRIFSAEVRRVATRGGQRRIAWCEIPVFDETGHPCSRRQGAERKPREWTTSATSAHLSCKVQGDPMEGALVRKMSVVLTRRRSRRPWCNVVLHVPSRTSRGRTPSGVSQGVG